LSSLPQYTDGLGTAETAASSSQAQSTAAISTTGSPVVSTTTEAPRTTSTSQELPFTTRIPIPVPSASSGQSQTTQSSASNVQSPTSISNTALPTIWNQTAPPDSGSGKSSILDPVVGGITGVIALILATVLGCILWRRRQDKRHTQHQSVPYVPLEKEGSTSGTSSMEGSPSTVQGSSFVEKRVELSDSSAKNLSTGISHLTSGSGFPASPELLAHKSFPSSTSTTHHLPTELPGPINIAPPPAIYAELPDNPSRKPASSHSRNNTSASIPQRTTLAPSRPNQNTPHIMSWATFEDGGEGKTVSTATALKGTLTAPKPDWSLTKGAGARSTPEIVVTQS
jgi:hypothetical protein